MKRRTFIQGMIGAAVVTAPVAKVLASISVESPVAKALTKVGVPIDSFKQVLIPLVRRVYPSLIASKILGVKPMPVPTNTMYSFSYRYVEHETNWGDYII